MKLEERTFGTPCTGKLLILSILRKIGDCEQFMLGGSFLRVNLFPISSLLRRQNSTALTS